MPVHAFLHGTRSSDKILMCDMVRHVNMVLRHISSMMRARDQLWRKCSNNLYDFEGLTPNLKSVKPHESGYYHFEWLILHFYPTLPKIEYYFGFEWYHSECGFINPKKKIMNEHIHQSLYFAFINLCRSRYS